MGVPAGDDPGPGPSRGSEHLAREELRQETGLIADKMHHLGHLQCANGVSSQGFDVFVAAGLAHGRAELELEEQDLLSRWFPRGPGSRR